MDERILAEWQTIDGDPFEAAYRPSYESFEMAEAVSFVYFLNEGKSIVHNGDHPSYLNCFRRTDENEIWILLRNHYGYEPDAATKDLIRMLSGSIGAASIRHQEFAVGFDNLGYNGSLVNSLRDDRFLAADSQMCSAIWEEAYRIGGGNPYYFSAVSAGYSPRQCTVFAWYRFWQVYGYSGNPGGAFGNGKDWAMGVVHYHPDKFILSSTPAPGSIVSFPATAGNPYGHVGFIEKVDGDTVWYSDGNVNGGGIRLNTKMSAAKLAEDSCGHEGCLVFAVPYTLERG